MSEIFTTERNVSPAPEIENPLQSKAEESFKFERPKNWIIESIVVILIFMLPCGLVALFYGCKVDKYYNNGDYQESLRMSKFAARWNLIGVCSGILLGIIYFGFLV